MSAADPTTQDAAEITRQSGSNFTLAFITLPRERRQAMITYYAFCRVVDDIVDEPGPSRSERENQLDRWRALFDGDVKNPNTFESEVLAVQEACQIPKKFFHLLIEGMAMDLDEKRYDTIDELLAYCYRVASAVGLVCMRVFGCDPERTDAYAENLGYCLQLTNIMRDVVEDWRKDRRIYMPREDFDNFGLTDAVLDDGPAGTRFHEMMAFQYERAAGYYEKTAAALPDSERKHVVATEMMRATYRAILEKMRADGFQVFEKRYRLGRLRKLAILTRHLAGALF